VRGGISRKSEEATTTQIKTGHAGLVIGAGVEGMDLGGGIEGPNNKRTLFSRYCPCELNGTVGSRQGFVIECAKAREKRSGGEAYSGTPWVSNILQDGTRVRVGDCHN